MSRSDSITYEVLMQSLKTLNQTHLLKFFNQLNESQKNRLLAHLTLIDVQKMVNLFKDSVLYVETLKSYTDYKPLEYSNYNSANESSPELLKKYWDDGLQLLGKGGVCVMLIDNENTPSGLDGTYKPGLPSGKCLFQIFAEKIFKVQELVMDKVVKDIEIVWYIMVHKDNIDSYHEYFQEHYYFGLEEENVRFFEQRTLPCFDPLGNIVLEDIGTVLERADGSGGLYGALENGILLRDMTERKIKYIFTFSTENIMVKMCDPIFIGYCLEKKADCGCKMVDKLDTNEHLSTFCLLNDRITILSSFEMNPEFLHMLNKEEQPVFTGGNISCYFISMEFLMEAVEKHLKDIHNHAIRVKFSHVDDTGERTKTMCITLKKFIYDMFAYAASTAIWKVARDSEFCAVDVQTDPKLKKKSLENYNKHNIYLIQKNGGTVVGKEVEISPLLSYDGEGLDGYCKNQKFKAPVCLEINKE